MSFETSPIESLLGGPRNFNKIPELIVSNQVEETNNYINYIDIEAMKAPIMRGIDRHGRVFVAITGKRDGSLVGIVLFQRYTNNSNYVACEGLNGVDRLIRPLDNYLTDFNGTTSGRAKEAVDGLYWMLGFGKALVKEVELRWYRLSIGTEVQGGWPKQVVLEKIDQKEFDSLKSQNTRARFLLEKHVYNIPNTLA